MPGQRARERSSAPPGRPRNRPLRSTERAQEPTSFDELLVVLATGRITFAGVANDLADVGARKQLADAIADAAEEDILDKRVVLQEFIWVDTHAVVHQVEGGMTPAYRGAVLGYLTDREKLWMAEALLFAMTDILRGECDPAVAQRLMSALDRLEAGWMRRTPLGRRLLDLGVAERDEEERA